MIWEFVLFLRDRFIQKRRNIGWGFCRWNCEYKGRGPQRILLDEGMCRSCYEDYCEEYK